MGETIPPPYFLARRPGGGRLGAGELDGQPFVFLRDNP